MLIAAAWLYALLALVLVLFQLALAFGAPWGHLAMGGRWPGRFPVRLRLGAVLQGALIALFALVVLGRAGAVSPAPPGWLFWIAVVFAAISAVMNLITPSIPERRLWGPVALLMLIAILRVAYG
ncbi:hypothetical protein [Sinisalibacter aestuarii]|uniref:Uncharacterized protein n=1 Tax=Sinisalibacter aestuarii TaxID=2949426 RepID=A0ABQ5LS16_9RHOB|nr:hypothetical protein [Sinisalibacter aestuarii]GKY87792.1 hypothetical protein STA1M1_16610 [Sinisalibacter aestuarii]